MLKWIGRLALLVALLAVAATVTAWWLLRGSLPTLDGELALPGLAAPVAIQRDALGVVTIDAASQTDAARALGYVHAQERFFEMDLLRRAPAGELAGLFGPMALEVDLKHRVHRMRARAEASHAQFAGEQLPALQAYADGVNAGLDAMPVRPWAYLLLRQTPRRWEVTDSALAGYAMYFDLQDADNTAELARARLDAELPPALRALLARDGSEWDAPLFGQARGNAGLPTAAEVDLRLLPMPEGRAEHREEYAAGTRWRPDSLAAGAPAVLPWERSGLPPSTQWSDHTGRATDLRPGSNNWAVAGGLTADGRAIVADDMHLGLRAPNIWFRVRLRYPDPRAPGGQVDVSGFSLPGLPAVIVGSNGHVAWGFTNSYADTADWFAVRPCNGEAPPASGCDAVTVHDEIIDVAGGEPQRLRVEDTVHGPILHPAEGGSPALALRWVAHQPGALNFGLADMAVAADLDSALAVAAHAATPAQNLMLADRNGRIAWRIIGPLPVRASGCDGRLRADAVDGTAPASHCAAWPISTGISPVLADPEHHRLWTANARVLDGEALARVGDGGYAFGARARQIRDALFARERFDEKDLLAIQLDDRALMLQRWWDLLGDEAGSAPADSALKALAEAGSDWDGHASVDSTGYRLVRAWRLAVHARIADGLTAPARATLGEAFAMPDLSQLEGVVWPLLQQRPAHLLPRRYGCEVIAKAEPAACTEASGWAALLEDAAREVRDELGGRGPLSERSWGERNTTKICHPLAGALPGPVAARLCMPAEALPGDGSMPRVQGPAFGASQRMVVAPSHEADGIIHMPGGQSGHPLSPFWGAGHDDWAQGRPSGFLPGPSHHELTLVPATRQ